MMLCGVDMQLSSKHSCLIWTTSAENARHLLKLTTESFVDEVNAAFVRSNERETTGYWRQG